MKLNPKILGSSVAGISLVVLAFVFHKDNPEPSKEPALHVSTERKIREFIPITDTDKNEIPDWQDSIVEGEINLEEIKSNTPYKPETETGKLAIELAESVRSASLTNDSLFSSSKLITDKVTELSRSNVDKSFTSNDIKFTDSDNQSAKRNYGNQIARIAINNAMDGKVENELLTLQRSLTRNDPDLLKNLDPIVDSYQGMIYDMTILPVPPSMTREHLSLLNVYQALLTDIKAFRNVYEDAIPAMLRFRRYLSDVQALQIALTNLYQKLDDEGIKWVEGEDAALLVKDE